MGIKWSWSFGEENNDDLLEMGFDVYDFGNTFWTTQSALPLYTYPGSPAGRKSLTLNRDVPLITVPGAASAEGWVAVSFYCSETFNEFGDNAHAIRVKDNNSGKSIKVYSNVDDSQTMVLEVDNTFDPSGSITVSQNDWHTIALQYSMTGNVWSARWYLDGAAVGSLTTDVTNTPATEEALQLSIAGCGNTNNLGTHYGHIVTYDDWNDNGWQQVYVTRVQPTDGLGGTENVGTWAPTGAPNNWEAVESPYNTSSYSENSSSSPGDRLFIAAGLGSTIQTQTGVGPGSTVYGVTNHAWVTGSGLSGSVGIGKNDGLYSYSTGSSFFPDTNDPTYGYVTSGSFSITDSPTMVYEVE